MACDFPVKAVCSTSGKPLAPTSLGINVSEFLALSINVWFMIKRASAVSPLPGGHILTVLTDRTLALSWMHYASHSHSHPVCRLACFISAFFLLNTSPITLQGDHLLGTLNSEADSLSCFSITPMWASITLQQPPLTMCQPYDVPPKLLFALARTLTNSVTEVLFAELMTALLHFKLFTLPAGWQTLASMTSLYPSFPLGKRLP